MPTQRELSGDARPDCRTHLLVGAAMLLAGTVALVWATATSSTTARFNDFYREALPAYRLIGHGHVVAFVHLGPTYIGSLILRAPFALIPMIWGGGPRSIYFASTVPCLIAVAALCAWFGAQRRRRSDLTWIGRMSPVVYCVLNPLALTALLGGHPEAPFGAALCIGAVVLAVEGKAGWAGVLVGLAVVNKSWAVVAVPVVLAVLTAGRRRALLTTMAVSAAVLLPVMAVRADGFSAVADGVQIGAIFNPPQLLWWFGAHSWIAREARPLLVLIAAACAALWWIQRRHTCPRGDRLADALLLLTLVLLLRAALDPWNNLYYNVPFLFALCAYELRRGRMPTLTVIYTVALLLVVPNSEIPPMSHDLRAAVFAATVAPVLAWLIAGLYLHAGGAGVTDGPDSPADSAHGRWEVESTQSDSRHSLNPVQVS